MMPKNSFLISRPSFLNASLIFKKGALSGFTLAELIVVVAILAVLATIGFLAIS